MYGWAAIASLSGDSGGGTWSKGIVTEEEVDVDVWVGAGAEIDWKGDDDIEEKENVEKQEVMVLLETNGLSRCFKVWKRLTLMIIGVKDTFSNSRSIVNLFFLICIIQLGFVENMFLL